MLGMGVLALGLAFMADAQAPAGSRAQAMLSSGGLLSGDALGLGVQGEILREIDDPHTGDRWLLLRNDQFPGGPGRLVLIAARRSADGAAQRMAAPVAAPAQAELVPVIRLGDRLTVEEHTPVVDAVLEARALTPAAAGATFDARLTIGGRVVRAVAIGPGRAALQPGTGVRP